jgi:hypothetical protein
MDCIYIYVCVCVCVCKYMFILLFQKMGRGKLSMELIEKEKNDQFPLFTSISMF